VAPLATLAVAAITVVCACTGVIAYLTTTQPAQNSVAANTEIRNLRETVAQLRKQVSGVSENLDGLRTAVDQSSKATNDRFGRFGENLDRIERVSSSSTAKLDKLALAQVPAPAAVQSQPTQAAPMMASLASPEITGSVPPSAPRKLIKGWSVRQAAEPERRRRGGAWTAGARPWPHRGDQERERAAGSGVQRRCHLFVTQGDALIDRSFYWR
jgi:hypothetical protein